MTERVADVHFGSLKFNETPNNEVSIKILVIHNKIKWELLSNG